MLLPLVVTTLLLPILPGIWGKLETITNTQTNSTRQVVRWGKKTCCCDDSHCQPWGEPCNGDLSYPLCNPTEILAPEYSGNSYFGDSAPQSQSGTCSVSCSPQKWKYIYVCAQCPYRYERYDKDECAWGNLCVGCNNMPYETLSGNYSTGYECKTNPKPCPKISTVTDPYIVGGSQVVVDPTFAPFVKSLIACAKSAFGSKGGVYPQSTSRCTTSQGLTPAEVSDHQIGRAIDLNFRDGRGNACDRNCTMEGYCSYNTAKPDCAAITQKKNSAQTNSELKKFFQCASGIQNLEIGASYSKGDWNHFENGSPTADQVNDYLLQLKAFCQASPGCPGITKTNPSNDACKCFS